jgi:hypothetical protein
MIYRLRTKDTMLGKEMITLTFLLADDSVLQLTLAQEEMDTLANLTTHDERPLMLTPEDSRSGT